MLQPHNFSFLMFRKIAYLLVASHFTLITLVILRILDFDKLYRVAEKPLSFVTAINYSAWRFAFFTPDVGKSTEVEIVMENGQGKKIRYSTLHGFAFFTHNRESANRFYGYKVHTARDSMFIDLSSRSACTYLLNEHLGMTKIHFSMRGIQYPDMVDFQKGAKIAQSTFYDTSFGL